VIGRELSDWIAEGRVNDDITRLSYDWVAQSTLFTQVYGVNRGQEIAAANAPHTARPGGNSVHQKAGT